jgi:phage gp36-like protein
MAEYATTTELGELGLTKEALKKFPPAQQTKHLAAASRFVDSYLAKRYQLPLTAWDEDLKRAVCIIAAYELMAGGAGWNPVEGSADEHLYKRYLGVIKWLEAVREGDNTPTGIVDSSPEPGDDGLLPLVSSDEVRGW